MNVSCVAWWRRFGWWVALAMVCLAALPQTGARQFQNLGFEEVNATNMTPPVGWAHDLAPGWEWNLNGAGYAADTAVTVNGAIWWTVNSGWVGLMTADNPYGFPVVGKYGLFLAAGYIGGPSLVPTSMRQTGTIPPGTKSLQFLDYYWAGYGVPPAAGVEVRINDSLLPLYNSLLSVQPIPLYPHNYTTRTFESYADVSAYAGQQITLEFSIPSGHLGLDDIQFSPFAVVPEPATWALLGLGFVALLWSRARH